MKTAKLFRNCSKSLATLGLTLLNISYITPSAYSQDMADEQMVSTTFINGVAELDVSGMDLTVDMLSEFLYENESPCDFKLLISNEASGNCQGCSTSYGQLDASSNGTIPVSIPISPCTGSSVACIIRIVDTNSSNYTGVPNPCYDSAYDEHITEVDCSVNSTTYDVAFYNCGQVKIYLP